MSTVTIAQLTQTSLNNKIHPSSIKPCGN